MDRLGELRGEAGGSRDTTLDTTSPPSESFMTANDSASKYFSLSEDSEIDSTFDISPIKDESLASANDTEPTITNADELVSLSPIGNKSDSLDSYKIGKQIEAENILSGGVDIFDDNENSYDGDELVIDDNVDLEEKSDDMKMAEDNNMSEATLVDPDAEVANKDTEVVLQIDGKNVDAIDIGNGLYLYRKQGQEELAAVQIIDGDQQQPSFKFLKVRENAEGNLEVYEEIEIEVPKEVPIKEGKAEKTSHVPIKDIGKVIIDPALNKGAEKMSKTPQETTTATVESDNAKEIAEKSESNFNGKMKKLGEARKSPVIGSFTPMTFHSTPNKEGIPLTKTMVDQQLHPNRHSDNIKKTIEVHTDLSKQKNIDPNVKCKDSLEDEKVVDPVIIEHDKESIANEKAIPEKEQVIEIEAVTKAVDEKIIESCPKNDTNISEEKIEIAEAEIPRKDCEVEADENLDSISVEAVLDGENNKDIDCIPSNDSSQDAVSLEKHEETDSEKIQSNFESNATIINENKKTEDGKENCLSQPSLIGCEKKLLNADLISENMPASEVEKTDKNITEIIPTCNIIEEQVDDEFESNNLVISEVDVEMQEIKPNSESDIQHSELDKPESEKNNLVPSVNTGINAGEDNKKDEENIKKEVHIAVNDVDGTKNQGVVISIEVNKSNAKQEAGNSITDSDTNAMKIDNELRKQLSEGSWPLLHKIDVQKPTVKSSNEISLDKVSNYEISQDKQEPVSKEGLNSTLLTPIKQAKHNDENVVVPNAKVEELSTSVKEVASENVIKSEPNNDKKVESLVENAGELHTPEVQLKSDDNNIEPAKITAATEIKPINNNHAAVPFGKWTEANRQEFLNKIKEAKVPVNSSNSKQIKNSNDLNRRDVLKKIDSQRQSNIEIQRAKAQETNKLNVKSEVAFASKTTSSNVTSQESKIPIKSDLVVETKTKSTVNKKVTKQEPPPKTAAPSVTPATVVSVTNKEPSKKIHESAKRKEMNTQDLIDQTIEGMLHKSIPPTKTAQEISAAFSKAQIKIIPEHLDDIELKMNELHGIPFIERPPHELPRVIKTDEQNSVSEKGKTTKTAKIPKLLPFANKNEQNAPKDATVEVDSDEEVIEHVPITGDIDLKTKKSATKYPIKDKAVHPNSESKESKVSNDTSKKEAIITEKDFDKFARRNSFTYENCLTVNFDGKEPHNVIQTVKQKESPGENYSLNERKTEVKVKPPHKSQAMRNSNPASKKPIVAKYVSITEDPSNKNYQSKVQIAYQSFTAKRQNTCPITIIEDKPVKVIFMDGNSEYVPSQLNVQGKELSPAKKVNEPDTLTASTGDSLDSDIMESMYENKSQDEKVKTKHQRKQVLTPVETPELELIEPSDLGLEASPKKKRRTDDTKPEKNTKNVLPKKSYLLGRSSMIEDKANKIQDATKTKVDDTLKKTEIITSSNIPETALDSLVKAAELLETQAENRINTMSPQTDDSQQSTPVKRGRGRPRKYPLPEGTMDRSKEPSPQKKPRLSESRTAKSEYDSDEEVNSDGEIVKENWTMGKINENIVCPICNKLFRSENVVFKHVKHCTGPSPNRSDSDNRSPRRYRQSQESDTKSLESKSDDMEVDEVNPITTKDNIKITPKKRKSRDSRKYEPDKDNVIVIEDTPIKEKEEKNDDVKQHESRKMTKFKAQTTSSNLVCEFCGKTFRQLSYLANHKLQHRKEESKKPENETNATTKSVFSCEVCKKDFRKLHHLVQHRIIHNPNAMPSRLLRKSSSEQRDIKTAKEQDSSKSTEDLSAGFRCEPCDKSFRKLHHLVEHRETHDGINRQKNTTAVQPTAEKPAPSPQCDVCKKTFRKLHHLIEHKEQHVETSSEKSDDKSVKSLSTKDIIHECSLCYMVFPNEHSLTKHTVICQRKKRQSKQQKPSNTGEPNEEDNSAIKLEENTVEDIDDQKLVVEQPITVEPIELIDEPSKPLPTNAILEDISLEKENKIEIKPPEVEILPLKEQQPVKREPSPKPIDIPTEPSEVIKKPKENEPVIVQEVPKKKTPAKEKVGATVTKRRRTSNLPLSTFSNAKPAESSDDDEVRYMLNPNFKVDDTSEGKVFMKVRAKKRNSLQIERPNSKDLITRRISLQHPPKIPRLKAKPIEVRPVASGLTKNIAKITKLEPALSTDSDDSDVKYSFPKTAPEKLKPVNEVTLQELGRKSQRKSIADKRKSLSTIAKRKSLGKALGRQKVNPSPVKPIKRRTTEVEHRCDCGQLFSSAALLSRHTTLAHTPPRIRRRRSPPPEVDSKPSVKPALRKSSGADKTTVSKTTSKQADSRKSSVRSDVTSTSTKPSIATRTPVVKTEVKKSTDARKSTKPADKCETKAGANTAKGGRTPAHRGVPVPEKMKKLMNRMPKKK